LTPTVVPVTLTLKLHELLGTRAPLVKGIVPPPSGAVTIPELPPVQEPVVPLGVPTTKPAGKLSVKLTPVSVVSTLGLLTVKLNWEALPSRMVVGLNDLVSVGGDT